MNLSQNSVVPQLGRGVADGPETQKWSYNLSKNQPPGQLGREISTESV